MSRRRAAAAASTAHEFDDDEEEEEEDFVPGGSDDDEDLGADDDDDDGDDDDLGDNDEELVLLQGSLYVDADTQRLHYEGGAFHLTSDDALPWNVLDAACYSGESKRAASSECEIVMAGPCDPGVAVQSHVKVSPRRLRVSFSTSATEAADTAAEWLPQSQIVRVASAASAKEDEEDGKKQSATAPSCRVHGIQLTDDAAPSSSGGDVLEFLGRFTPVAVNGDTGGKVIKIPLVCQVRSARRTPLPVNTKVASAAAAAASPPDDDDDPIGGTATVDFTELMALHADAGIGVQDLQQGRGRRKRRAAALAAEEITSRQQQQKRPKRPPEEEADDTKQGNTYDDDDCGF